MFESVKLTYNVWAMAKTGWCLVALAIPATDALQTALLMHRRGYCATYIQSSQQNPPQA